MFAPLKLPFDVFLPKPYKPIEGTGDEFEIVLATNADGLDIIMTVRLEHESTQRPTRFGPCRGGSPHPLRGTKRVRDERQK